MNDRFLCKAKDINSSEWVIGYYVQDIKRPIIVNRTYYMTAFGSEEGLKQNYIDPKTLCQCTGLRDKNGVLIFEGDIVSTLINYGPGGDHLQEIEVTFDKKHGGWSWQKWVFDNNKTLPTVIGNIHDKELNND